MSARSAAAAGVQRMRIYDWSIRSSRASISSSSMNSPPVGLFNAFPDGGTKAGILLKQAQRGILNQALGIGACLASNLRKLRFLLRCELDIHGLQVTRNHGLRQPAPATGTSGRGCLNGFGKSSPGNRQKR